MIDFTKNGFRDLKRETKVIELMMKHFNYFLFFDDCEPFTKYLNKYLNYNKIVFSNNENEAYLDVYKYIYDLYLKFCKEEERPPFDFCKANISETQIYNDVLNDKALQAHVKDLCLLYDYKPCHYVDEYEDENESKE